MRGSFQYRRRNTRGGEAPGGRHSVDRANRPATRRRAHPNSCPTPIGSLVQFPHIVLWPQARRIESLSEAALNSTSREEVEKPIPADDSSHARDTHSNW